MRLQFVIVIILLTTYSHAQQTVIDHTAINWLDTLELRKHIEVLASDSLEGRQTASPGQKKAAAYILSQFKEAGLKPYNDSTYYQSFPLYSWHWENCTLSFKNRILSSDQDLIYQSASPTDSLSANCIFVGFGEDSIIKDLDLKDKVAFAFTNTLSHFYKLYYKLKSKGAVGLIIANPSDDNAFEDYFKQAGSSNLQTRISKSKPYFSKNASRIFIVKPIIAEELFDTSLENLLSISSAKIKKLPETKINAHCPVVIDQVITENVAGYIPGKTNETVVLSAHYDHIGKRGTAINYGADDNASGTSALIALAKTFGRNQEKYDRTILFLATTGEEMGLLGALNFAEKQTQLPFEIKANLNIDMIGRRDSIDKKNYIYLVGAKEYPIMDSLCQIANQQEHLTLDYGYANGKGFGNFLNLSDHYAFHKQGIPVLGLFSGLHADYHKPTDTVDKIEFEEMLKRVRLIYGTTVLVINSSSFNDN